MPSLTTIRHAAACLAVLLAAGCAALDPHDLVGRHARPAAMAPDTPVPPPAGLGLGEAGRRAAIDFVWTTVNDRYYDPGLNGVDWRAARERWQPRALAAATDEEFWDLLDRMAGEIRDAHTRVESPLRAAQVDRNESVTLGFAFRPVEGRLAVTGVNPDADAWWAGARPGMTLVAVDGVPAQAAYDKALAEARGSSTAQARHLAAARRILAGDEGSTASVTFARGDGSTFTAPLKRSSAIRPPGLTHRVLPSGLGYLRLTAWQQSQERAMIAAIAALKDTPGLVIDLRGNPGGSALMVRNVAAQFFPRDAKVAYGRALTRTGRPVTLAFDWIEVVKLRQELEGEGTYAGPVAVLVDAASGSGSELFAGILQTQKRAVIVGRTTCGCLLAFLGYAQVPGGGRLAYSEVGFVFPDGRRIEGVGVVPDVPVPLSLADLLAGRDRALEAAQARLLRGGDAG